MRMLFLQTFFTHQPARIIQYPQAQHSNYFLPHLERDEAQRPAYHPSRGGTLHEDALHKVGRCGRGEELIVVEAHGATMLHHPGCDGLLIR